MRRIARYLGLLPLIGVLGIAVVVPGRMALGMAEPRPDSPVVVLAAPWANAIPIATGVGGRLIAEGRFSSVAMASSDNPEFIAALYSEGAWLVLDADMAGFLCGPTNVGDS